MSINRFAKKRDAVEGDIITALERAGWHIWQLDTPCDLLLRKDHFPPGMFRMLEVKTPHGKAGKARQRNDQEAQANFIAATGTPIVTSPLEALRALGEMP